MRSGLLFLVVLLVSGCVQVEPGSTTTGGRKQADKAEQFATADEALVNKILEQPDLNDAVRLRRYAALYQAVSMVIDQDKALPIPKILSGVEKATGIFMQPRSVGMQSVLVGLMPKSAGAETDRAVIQKNFASLSLACHAAAHRVDQKK